jgi:hypothetical protein
MISKRDIYATPANQLFNLGFSDGSRPNVASALQGARETASIHGSSGVIWAARTVVEGSIWPFLLAFGRTPPLVAIERMTIGVSRRR